jgi:hypothetical protein
VLLNAHRLSASLAGGKAIGRSIAGSPAMREPRLRQRTFAGVGGWRRGAGEPTLTARSRAAERRRDRSGSDFGRTSLP